MDGWPRGFDFVSGIDEIFNKENFTLEDILSHDDVISECKYLNAELVEYLSKKEVLEKLVGYVIDCPPTEQKESRTKTRSYMGIACTHPYIASEIFQCEVMDMLDAFFDHPSLLHQLFSLLDHPPPLDPGNCAYFCKVMVVLITKKHSQFVTFVQSNNLLDKILDHIGLYSIMELLIRIGWDDGSGGVDYDESSDVDANWLQQAQLVSKLVAKLDPKFENEQEVHANAACALVDAVVKSSPLVPSATLLIVDLHSKPILERLFQFMFSGSASSLTHTLSVAIVLVQSYTDRRLQDKQMEGKCESTVGAKEIAPIILHVLEALPQLLPQLQNPPLSTLQTQCGELSPPCGSGRLKIIELVLALVRCVAEDDDRKGDATTQSVSTRLVDLEVFTPVLDLFFKYPWNNMLHGLVEGIIHTVLDSTQEEPSHRSADPLVALRKSLFISSHMLQKISDAFDRNIKAVAAPKGARLGFMGHLLRVCAVTAESYPVAALTALGLSSEELQQWQNLMEGPFSTDLQQQQIILGGRRPGAFSGMDDIHDVLDTQLESQAATLGQGQFSNYHEDEDEDDDEFFNWEQRAPNSDSDEETDRLQEVSPEKWPNMQSVQEEVPITEEAVGSATSDTKEH